MKDRGKEEKGNQLKGVTERGRRRGMEGEGRKGRRMKRTGSKDRRKEERRIS